jgi:hypothetical protein
MPNGGKYLGLPIQNILIKIRFRNFTSKPLSRSVFFPLVGSLKASYLYHCCGCWLLMFIHTIEGCIVKEFQEVNSVPTVFLGNWSNPVPFLRGKVRIRQNDTDRSGSGSATLQITCSLGWDGDVSF